MQFTLHGARLVDATMDIGDKDITIDGAHIQAIEHTHSSQDHVINATDSIVMPGFIEVHTHGGGGFNLHTTDAEEIRSYARWIPATGVTSFLVAVVGIPDAIPEQQLCAAVETIDSYQRDTAKPCAEPLGIFLEGPYISARRRGAHPAVWLRTPLAEETERIVALTRGHLRLITLAPELPGASAMIRRLVEEGITVSVGHTDATYEQTLDAIKLGATHMTHCFNAMPPLLHRAPGPLAALAQSEHVSGELIADGVHVHPAVADILVKMLGPQRTVVVTDALAGAGVPNAIFEFAGQLAHVSCGAAHLSDGTLTGSVLTMDQALRNMLAFTQCSLSEVVGMLTLNPASAAKVAGRKGRLQAGYDADLLIFDTSLTLQATICRGHVTFATDQWHDRFAL